jgi:hypothetical protein
VSLEFHFSFQALNCDGARRLVIWGCFSCHQHEPEDFEVICPDQGARTRLTQRRAKWANVYQFTRGCVGDGHESSLLYQTGRFTYNGQPMFTIG